MLNRSVGGELNTLYTENCTETDETTTPIDKSKPTPLWIKDFGRYQTWNLGTRLIVAYTDLKAIQDRKVGYWPLCEMLEQWNWLLQETFMWQQRQCIENFVPICQKHINAIVAELLKRRPVIHGDFRKKDYKVGESHVPFRAVKLAVRHEAVYRHYVPDLEQKGRILKGKCPLHTEKTGSFTVWPDKWGWRCFGSCNTGGDVFNLIMNKEEITFAEAVVFAWENFT